MVEEVSTNKKFSVTLPYGCNSYERSSLSVTLGLRMNYIYKEVSQKEILLFCDTSRS